MGTVQPLRHYSNSEPVARAEKLLAGKAPLHFVGGARYVLSPVDAINAVEQRLTEVASLDHLTEERVRRYCDAINKPFNRFEHVILREAFKVVSPTDLVRKLVEDLRARPLDLADRTIELDTLVAIIDPSRTPFATCRVSSPVGGLLSLDGTLTGTASDPSESDRVRVRSRWDVGGGVDYTFGTEDDGAGVPAIDRVVGYVGGSALARFIDVVHRRLATLLETRSEPTFVAVERLLRLGRLTHKTRVYLLYWSRMREFVTWAMAAE